MHINLPNVFFGAGAKGLVPPCFIGHQEGPPVFCGVEALLLVVGKWKPSSPNHQTTKPPNHQTTKPPNHQTTKPPNHQTTKPPNHQTTKPPNHQTTKPPNHQTTKPPNHQTTKPPNHQTTKPPNHQTTNPNHPSRGTLSLHAEDCRGTRGACHAQRLINGLGESFNHPSSQEATNMTQLRSRAGGGGGGGNSAAGLWVFGYV